MADDSEVAGRSLIGTGCAAPTLMTKLAVSAPRIPRRTWSRMRRSANRSEPPRSDLAANSGMLSNGEVEGPHDHVRLGPRARNIDWVPRPQTDDASRPPPTIVRRTRSHESDHAIDARVFHFG